MMRSFQKLYLRSSLYVQYVKVTLQWKELQDKFITEPFFFYVCNNNSKSSSVKWMVNAKLRKSTNSGGKKWSFLFFFLFRSPYRDIRFHLVCEFDTQRYFIWSRTRLKLHVKWIQCNWSLRILFNSSLHLFF